MKIKLSKQNLFYYLIIITPIIDTLNGLFLIYSNKQETILGSIYRGGLLIFFSYIMLKEKKNIYLFLVLLYYLLSAIIKGIYNGLYMSYISYALKWMFPVILIYAYKQVFKNNIIKGRYYINKIMSVWSIFFPLSLIIEYILGIGKSTYYDAGFKGLYYSTNDIAFALSVVYCYSLCQFVETKKILTLTAASLSALAIVILSTKSCIVIVVLATIYFLVFYKKGISKIKNIILGGIIILSLCFVVSNIFDSEINNIIIRYSNMWNMSVDNASFKIADFFTFATSGRTNRISVFKNKNDGQNFSVMKLLFGWISPDNATVVEMDFHDLLFQYGIIGECILLFFYIKILTQRDRKQKLYVFLYILGFVYAILGGHVISGALAGTVYALICCMVIDVKNVE